MAALFKTDGAETESRYSISEWWLEPHTQGPDAHSHPEEAYMSRITRAVVGAFAVLGAAYVAMLVIAFVGVPGGTRCFSYHVMDVSSPTSAHVATVENNSCTPSHELQTVVYLSSDKGALHASSAYVFSAPSAVRDGGTYSPMPLQLTWHGDSELQIAFPRGTQVQSRVESIDNVKVMYKALESR
jgi:hypothetical protein